ncbi:MAG TPA: class I SAM-dependent methyltransferase [Streptosporangiaceae bacterium]|jgi:demethylmenaquinone methyltransferase/2-methoxy-6-polyprenyl-1,4-benzoquinol methylase|nr:class I SAM-dependent methyltransferase [Streptosporangiaceae bacterium]
MSTSTGAPAANGRAERLRGDDVVHSVFTGLPARYDRLAYLLSFGQDRRWRRAVVDRVAAASPGRVLDVATGPAGIALAVAERTGAQMACVDLSEPMLRAGAANIRRAGRERQMGVALAHADRLPFGDATFDAVVFSYLLRYVEDPAATVAELARCVRPGGTLASLDFHVPPKAGWRACWHLYTRAALPVLGMITGGPAWLRVGQFLGPSISTHYRRHPLAEHEAAWRAAGMEQVQVRLMSLGGGLVMSGIKRPAAGAAGEPG